MKETLTYLFEGNKLTYEEAKNTLLSIGEGNHSEAEFASFLTVYLMRKITPIELAGFRDAMVQLCLAINLSAYNAIDIVGTGGDGKNTFNISTLASFIVAGAGIKVTKHGNYAVSSKSGSSNVLEFLGYKFSNNPDKLKSDLEKAGICFLHAPLFHPAMKNIAPVRKALKVKTFFNILGPMINPSSPKYQLLGVYSKDIFELYKNVYQNLDVNYSIVNSVDGYDEVSLTDNVRYANNSSEGILSPGQFGFDKVTPEDLFGGNSVEEAAKIFIQILDGKGTKAQNNVAFANAAMAINTVHREKSLEDCVLIAKESLISGKAKMALTNMVE